MSEKLAESVVHKRLVKALAEYVKKKGFEITCSSSLGLKECDKTEDGFIPDLKAYSNNESLSLYGEAKTEDDIDNDHTRAQIKSFSGRRMKDGKLVPFYLIVPKGSAHLAWKVIGNMTLTPDEKNSINVLEES